MEDAQSLAEHPFTKRIGFFLKEEYTYYETCAFKA